jgi:perosamine synthetase
MKYNTAFPYFPEEDIQNILRKFKELLEGKGLLSMGKYVKEFEKKFADYIGVEHAIATTSCTSALETVLFASGIGEGDEVIIPSQTFIATASAVVRSGATPIFSEVNQNFLLDFEDMKSRITSKTKAVIFVHFSGLTNENIFTIKDWLNERGVLLLEDAAHAHGASVFDKKIGSIGDAATFSFYSTKNMTTGEGGMITTNNTHIAEKCTSIRSRGLDIKAKYEIFNELGTNQRMTEVQALMGLSQLNNLNDFVIYRNKLANAYNKYLQPLVEDGSIRLIKVNHDTMVNAYWRYTVFLKNGQNREEIRKKMEGYSIKIDWAYQPMVHLQPIFKKMYGMREGDLPLSEQLAETHICLPIHLGISMKGVKYISDKFIESI